MGEQRHVGASTGAVGPVAGAEHDALQPQQQRPEGDQEPEHQGHGQQAAGGRRSS